MIKKAKHAQAQIITTVLIILLVLAAIVIVWQVVQSTIESGADPIEGTASCIGIDLEIVSISLANGSNDEVEVRRLSGGDMNAVADVRFIVGGSSIASSDVLGPAESDLEPLESKTYEIAEGTISSGEKVEVAAILSDDDATICNIMDDATAE